MGRLYDRGSAAVADTAPPSATEFDLDDDPLVIPRERGYAAREAPRVSREADATRVDRDSMQNYLDQQLSLSAPPARSGFRQRWVRDGSVDPSDNAHWFKKMREGWQPRDPQTVPPELRRMYPSAKLTDGSDVIRVGGSILCEMPEQVGRQRDAAVAEMIERQTRGILPSAQDLQAKGRGAFGPIMVTEDKEKAVVRGPRPDSEF